MKTKYKRHYAVFLIMCGNQYKNISLTHHLLVFIKQVIRSHRVNKIFKIVQQKGSCYEENIVKIMRKSPRIATFNKHNKTTLNKTINVCQIFLIHLFSMQCSLSRRWRKGVSGTNGLNKVTLTKITLSCLLLGTLLLMTYLV